MSAFIYLFEGGATIAGTALSKHELAVLGTGETLEVIAPDQHARFIFVAGMPLGEPIVQYGPFVMNTAMRSSRRSMISQGQAGTQQGEFYRPMIGQSQSAEGYFASFLSLANAAGRHGRMASTMPRDRVAPAANGCPGDYDH